MDYKHQSAIYSVGDVISMEQTKNHVAQLQELLEFISPVPDGIQFSFGLIETMVHNFLHNMTVLAKEEGIICNVDIALALRKSLVECIAHIDEQIKENAS